MRISELKGEQALDVLADIMEPAADIMSDKEVAELYRAGNGVKAVSVAIKNHKKAVIEILAILDGEDPATYEPPIMALPVKLLEILNDPGVQQVFTPQGQNEDAESSGSVTGNTKGTGTT